MVLYIRKRKKGCPGEEELEDLVAGYGKEKGDRSESQVMSEERHIQEKERGKKWPMAALSEKGGRNKCR